MLLDLPWYDILCPHILPYLSWPDLFRLRHTSRAARDVVSEYFRYLTSLDLSFVARHFSSTAFFVVCDESFLLRELDVSNSQHWITDDQLVPVLCRNERLTRVCLDECTSLSNACLLSLASHCPHITHLSLRNCRWVGVEALDSLATHLVSSPPPSLTHLDLTGCWEVTDSAVETLVTSCAHKLRYLSLGKIYGITDLSVKAVALICRDSLRQLDISGCWRVTDQGVWHVGEYCKGLREMRVVECARVTEASLGRIRARGVNVQPAGPVVRYKALAQNIYLQI